MLTYEKLREILDYDPKKGELTWKVKPNRKIVIGSIAGTMSHNRIQIRINGKIYAAHRLAWLHYYGAWPKGIIDHKNGDWADNRIENLRDCDYVINNQNRRQARKDSSTGVLGVTTFREKYRARIDHKHLGLFDTKEAASKAYIQAKRRLHDGGML